MKRIFILLLSVLSLTAFAQQPNWVDEGQRASNYPKSKYFTGFVEGQKSSKEQPEAAIERLKSAARVEALSTIRAHVQSETTSNVYNETLETMDAWEEKMYESLNIRTSIKVEMEIPGLQVEAWRNPQNGTILAFAYVKKSSLIKQLEKKITVCLTKIESAMDQLDQQIAAGQKMQARDAAPKILPQFHELDEAQKILAAVDEDAEEESLQLLPTRALRGRLTQIIADLKNGINIYLSCNAKMFNTNYTALKGEIQGELSKLGCTFVNSAAQSDWAVYVDASAREFNTSTVGGFSSYYVYIDAKISIDKTATGQRIYEEQLEPVKGSWTTNYVDAARYDGYKQISPIISAAIKKQIQQ